MTVVIPLSKGQQALVDDEDAHLAEYAWRLNNNGYAQRHVKIDGAWTGFSLLHREIMGLVKGDPRQVDHINGNPLDNRRENLRLCTQAENTQNRAYGYGKSKYRGVTWSEKDQRWSARVMIRGQRHFLGLYDTDVEAGAVAAEFRATHMPFAVN